MLNQMLSQMLSDTKQGKPARRKLNGGLHIAIAARSSAYTLILSRDQEYPSPKEWETVLKHWPYKTEAIMPARIIDNYRRMALKADIPTARAIQGQMFDGA